MREYNEVMRWFYISADDFRKSIAAEFKVTPADVIIKPHQLGIDGFEVKLEVLTECVTIVDERVCNALKLNNYDFDCLDWRDEKEPIIIEATIKLYKDKKENTKA